MHFPQYLGEVKFEFISKCNNRMICIVADKNETFKVAMQLKQILSNWHIKTYARNVHPSQPHKNERRRRHREFDCVVNGPGIPIPQWYTVATRLHSGFPCRKPAAEQCSISYNRQCWLLDTHCRPHRRRDEVWCRAWADRLSLLWAVSRFQILWQAEVIWERFDIEQNFVHKVALTPVASMKWRPVRAIISWHHQHNKQLDAMSSFAENI